MHAHRCAVRGEEERGGARVQGPGRVRLVLCNAHSRLRAKTVRYGMTSSEAEAGAEV